ncbi:MAG: glycosyltransferase, partial [Proteobacteria bacterium]|nr:glycosyltransferase [Pseudomonadota bacterium]
MDISIVVVTYRREQVLVDTITKLLEESTGFKPLTEIILVDQTEEHDQATQNKLDFWQRDGLISLICLDHADLVGAMNLGLCAAQSDIVLYLDDDIIPAPGLIQGHIDAHMAHPEAIAVVGQVLQPGEVEESVDYSPHGEALRRYLDFPFYSSSGRYIENAIACNLSLKRQRVLEWGTFDQRFGPPVAYRFETDFAKRLIKDKHKIWFEPSAGISPLAAGSGGTRAEGGHLGSSSPNHGVGDYYYALKQGEGWDC